MHASESFCSARPHVLSKVALQEWLPIIIPWILIILLRERGTGPRFPPWIRHWSLMSCIIMHYRGHHHHNYDLYNYHVLSTSQHRITACTYLWLNATVNLHFHPRHYTFIMFTVVYLNWLDGVCVNLCCQHSTHCKPSADIKLIFSQNWIDRL